MTDKYLIISKTNWNLIKKGLSDILDDLNVKYKFTETEFVEGISPKTYEVFSFIRCYYMGSFVDLFSIYLSVKETLNPDNFKDIILDSMYILTIEIDGFTPKEIIEFNGDVQNFLSKCADVFYKIFLN